VDEVESVSKIKPDGPSRRHLVPLLREEIAPPLRRRGDFGHVEY
jgi:hypothetical protein